ncbi:MAG: site-2 protease family protein [Rhodospirillales bacterium]|nr:site-2 protease family protein [Rhodospirillales bacterium]MCW9003449.1 site-2 protease family protein [Rhodospirillales bacterium]
MFGKRISLFDLLGFRIYVDFSWIFIAALVTWSLAQGFFPGYYDGLSQSTYWTMGVVGALGLFFSIILHELAHSVVARQFGIPIKGITLFIFGGVAEMDREPPDPKSEFLMAIAGPIASGALALFFFAVSRIGKDWGLDVATVGVAGYLALINGILAAFNLVPAFPLDGGRALRAALWHLRGDLRAATRIAAQSGSIFGLMLILLGFIQLIGGNVVGGMWWGLIGLFLRAAAAGSVQQMEAKRVLTGEPVSRFMTTNVVAVRPGMPLADFVQDIVYPTHHEFFPVTDHDGRVAGCVTAHSVKAVPHDQWHRFSVEQIMGDCDITNIIAPDNETVDALALMNRTGNSRLMVVDDNGHLIGLLTLKDLLAFLSLKLDLEGDE